MAPELRRSAIYVMIGCAVGGSLAWYVLDVLQEETSRAVGVCAMLGAIDVAAILPLRWAVRVDDAGVARRWLIGWDLWSWDVFASGRIEKRCGAVFVDPQRPWWRRKLQLGWLATADHKNLIQLINQRYCLPPPPTARETLRIKYGFRRALELDSREIRLIVRGETSFFTWQDVKRLHITRADPVRRDFAHLSLTVGDHEIELRWYEGTPSWRGAKGEELNEFLQAHVPADLIDVDLCGERPARAEDVERELAKLKKNERDFRVASVFWLASMAALGIWSAIEFGVLPAILVMATALLFAPIHWVVSAETRKHRQRLEGWLAEFQWRRGTEP